MSNILKDIAPAVATALGGPLAGLAVGFISKQFGVSEDKVQEVIAGTDPLKLKQLEQDFITHLEDNGIKLQLSQIEVNTEEAKNTNIFVSGWRPFVGWTCASALAYSSIMEPIARFVSEVMFGYQGAFPVIDTTVTFQVLTGLLGIAGMRSFEKYHGVTK